MVSITVKPFQFMSSIVLEVSIFNVYGAISDLIRLFFILRSSHFVKFLLVSQVKIYHRMYLMSYVLFRFRLFFIFFRNLFIIKKYCLKSAVLFLLR